MAFTGAADIVQDLGPKYFAFTKKKIPKNIKNFFFRICQIFNGKGAAKGKRFQAKVTKINSAARQQAEELLLQHFDHPKVSTE